MLAKMVADRVKKLGQMHWLFAGYVTLAACIGFAMMYSAAGGNLQPWAGKQMIYFLFAFVLMTGLAVTSAATLMRYAYVLYGAGILTLIAVKIMGYMGKGAQRWVEFGGFNFQPSELMKIGVILALAKYYHSINQNDVSKPAFFIPPLLIIALPVELIRRQPNLGTATIVMLMSVILCYMAGARVRMRYIVMAVVALLVAAPLAWNHLHDYQKQRVITFLHPEEDPQGAGYNIIQSMIAIGSGGMFGKGYMQGSQGQLDFLPEKHTDFIFTMLAEEFGFFGCFLMLLLYLVLISHGISIFLRCKHLFGKLLAVGVSAMLFVHIIINISMVMGLIPVVGVPLPLLSYGGSIMLSIMLGFGLMQNAYVHRDVNLPKPGGLL